MFSALTAFLGRTKDERLAAGLQEDYDHYDLVLVVATPLVLLSLRWSFGVVGDGVWDGVFGQRALRLLVMVWTAKVTHSFGISFANYHRRLRGVGEVNIIIQLASNFLLSCTVVPQQLDSRMIPSLIFTLSCPVWRVCWAVCCGCHFDGRKQGPVLFSSLSLPSFPPSLSLSAVFLHSTYFAP